jgi:asparagine synthase (glutamine-hydrolysing)
MCGIAGIFLYGGSEESVDGGVLRHMRDLLSHRGPDDAGEYLSGPIGLAHRRLSIIDVATGHQPLGNEDGTIQIVYNGEVYNFAELQREAEAAGHHFATRCDTEAIVHLYEELGDDVVTRLRGMFAFAVWDGPRRRLVLARDRAGIKPLYYAHQAGRFAFASEIRPLLALDWVSRDVDEKSLDTYLDRGYVPGPRTIFKDVWKLPAAHRLTIDPDGLRITRYWPDGPPRTETGDEQELAASLFDRLSDSVKSHLVSDVPLGAFLSGGLDSSIVVALMRRHCTGPLKTFSVAIDAGDHLNEGAWARQVARHFETEHAELVIGAADMPGLLQASAPFLDEPVSDPAALPTFALAKLARESVTVALTGEGADETWAGYTVFRKGEQVASYRRLPGWFRRTVTDPLLLRWPSSGAGARFVDAARNPAYLARLSHLDLETRRSIYSPQGALAVIEPDHSHAGESTALGGDPLGSITMDLLESHLPERLLLKVDRMTMANSLEARVPFLDHPLVEFALSVPRKYKLRGGQTKYLLRNAFAGALPPDILARPKHGFDLPCAEWLRTTIAPLAGDLFADPLFGDFIDGDRQRLLWKRHLAGRGDYGTQVWALMTLQLWGQSIGLTR